MTQIVRGRQAFHEQTATGTTTNSFADAIDLDLRGGESASIDIENTHGSNGLNYKVLVRYANYSAGEDVEFVASTAVAAGAKDYVQLEKGYARCKVQVQAAIADSHATYSIFGLRNRL